MRKLLISILLASAAASPALADRPDHSAGDNPRAERPQAREQARPERPVQVQRPQFSGAQGHMGGPQPFVARQFVQPNPGPDPRQVEAFHGGRGGNNDAPDSVRDWRGERRPQVFEQRGRFVQDRGDRMDNEALRRLDRPLPQVMRTRGPVVSDFPRPGTQPPMRVDDRRRDEVRWNTDWRRDRRYDWRDWRERNRSRFRIGIYYDPFGWGYRPFEIGWRMWPNYYSSNYWINDPWEYRLPYAPPGTQWVRYYNDAVLVDIYSGQVVDVIRGFFW